MFNLLGLTVVTTCDDDQVLTYTALSTPLELEHTFNSSQPFDYPIGSAVLSGPLLACTRTV